MKQTIEQKVLQLFGVINPVTMQYYIDILRDDLMAAENTLKGVEIKMWLAIANQLLNKMYAKESYGQDSIVSPNIRQEIGTRYSRIFSVSFDWMIVIDDRKLNAQHFFKLYTMQNDTRDILWQMKHELN